MQFWWGGCQNGPWAVGVPGGIRDRRVIVDVSWVLRRAIAGSDQEVKSRSVATSEARTFSVRCHSHVCCPLRNRARVRLQTRPSAACGRTPARSDSETGWRAGIKRDTVWRRPGRRAIRGIRPAVLDDSGLDAAIDDLIDQFSHTGSAQATQATGRGVVGRRIATAWIFRAEHSVPIWIKRPLPTTRSWLANPAALVLPAPRVRRWSTWSSRAVHCRPRHQVQHRELCRQFQWADGQPVREAQLLLTEKHETIFFENRYRCRDGSYRWFSWQATMAPKLGQIVAAARDVTTHKLQTEALREAEERFQIYMNNSPAIAWAKDDQGRIPASSTRLIRTCIINSTIAGRGPALARKPSAAARL